MNVAHATKNKYIRMFKISYEIMERKLCYPLI
jgi:hypothetical protein